VDYTQVWQLARELGVRSNDIFWHAEQVGIKVNRVAANLTPSQVQRIRDRITGMQQRTAERQQAAARAQARAQGAMPKIDHTLPAGLPDGPTTACACCQLRISSPRTRYCEPCGDHYFIKGEDSRRRDSRTADHEERHVRAYRTAWTKAHEYADKMKGALHSRDVWRGALVEVIGEHAPTKDGCACGDKAFPCFTIRSLERINRGIAREVDRFLAMPEDMMRRELYRDDHWDMTA
jgi:hypothetical protein